METAWVVAVILLGAFVQGLTGFGLALVSVPLLSLMLDVKVAVPVAGLFGWMITFPLVYRMRRHIRWRTGLIMAAGSLPGSWLGASLLRHVPARWILVAMGLVLVASAIYALRGRRTGPADDRRQASPPRKWPRSLLAGFSSGALGAAVGEPGPPAIAYTAMQRWSADEVKGSLLFFFMLQMIGAIIGFWSKSLLTPDVFAHIGRALPGFVVGLFAGMKAWDRLRARRIDYHGIVHVFLLCIGAYLLTRNLLFR